MANNRSNIIDVRGLRESDNRITIDQVKMLQPFLSFLNPRDRDVLYLIFLSGKRQTDVASVLGRTQPALCYDIRRIKQRLSFISYLHSVFDIFYNFIVNEDNIFRPKEIEVFSLMYYCTSFTVAAQILGAKQVDIRNNYDEYLQRMKRNKLWEVYEVFQAIRHNLNIVKRRPCKLVPADVVL